MLYLRNVILQFMKGGYNEQLVRVIATLLEFSPEQEREIAMRARRARGWLG